MPGVTATHTAGPGGTAETVQSLERSGVEHRSAIKVTEQDSTRTRRRIRVIGAKLTFSILARFSRRIVDQTILWRPGAILISVVAFGGAMYAATRSPAAGVVCAMFELVVSYFLFIYPADSDYEFSAKQMEIERGELNKTKLALDSRLLDLNVSLKAVNEQLTQARNQLATEERATSDQYRRARLLAENWKAMRSVEFEKFLERVFTELGYAVETTRVSGDQGVDLIVSLHGRRIAIQIKGYVDAVSNSAVQEVHAGMTHYRCDASAVITNSRFTRSAVELAKSVRCQLIDEDSLPQVILGGVNLWSMCFENNS